MRLTALITSLLGLFLIVPAVADETGKKDKVSIRGMAASVTAANDEQLKAGVLGELLMEGKKDKDTEYDKAIVKVTKATKIFKMVGGDLKPATFDDLKGAGKMEIQFTGPVAESFPVQATAGKIVILGR
jgi:hypothetical protein